jgi:hypothetical protein
MVMITDDPPSSMAPLRRRLAFAALTALLVFVVLEGLSWIVLSCIEGRPCGHRTLAARRTAVINGARTTEVLDPREQGEGADEPGSGKATSVNVIHPYLGFVMAPDPDIPRHSPRYRAQAADLGFPYNFHDLFNPETPQQLVVAVVGGSVAQQIAQKGRPFPLLEGALAGCPRFQGRDVKVLNLAIGGFKQPQQLMTIAYFLALGMNIDVVINIDGFNEVSLPVSENLVLGENPFFPRSWSLRVGDMDPEERRSRGEVTFLWDFRSEVARGFSARPLSWSLTSGLVWRLLDRALEGRLATCERLLLSRGQGEGPRDIQALGPAFGTTQPPEIYHQLADGWQRCSIQLSRLCAANGIEYYHFLQPNQNFPGSKPLNAEEKRIAWDPESDYVACVGVGYPLLRERASALREAGVSFVDLTQEFAHTDETVYRDRCCHFTLLGIERLVARIAETVGAGTHDPD